VNNKANLLPEPSCCVTALRSTPVLRELQIPVLRELQIPVLRNTLSVHAAAWHLTPNSHKASGTLLLISLALESQLISVVHWQQDIYEH
jgi:hypothetical protein